MRKPYLLAYPDGTKAHIGRAERDRLVAARQVRKIAPCEYVFLRPVQVFHSFADLKHYSVFERPDVRAFLEGSFIWEFGNHRTRELLETPDGMAERLADLEPLEAT